MALEYVSVHVHCILMVLLFRLFQLLMLDKMEPILIFICGGQFLI